MSISSILAIYFIVWWLTFLAVLPFAIKSQVETGSFVEGTDPGAPVKHNLLLKFMITTLISSVLFGLLYYSLTNGLLNFE